MAELKTLCESNKYKQFFEVWHVFAFRISTPYLSSCNGAVRIALAGKVFTLNAASTFSNSLI